MDKILKRSDKVAFMGVTDDNGDVIFYRMRGFTEFSQNKNPVEYSRRYVDEKIERNDVVAYAPSISYSFDKFAENAVHLDLAGIADNELVGSDAIRTIYVVDMSTDDEVKSVSYRDWVVIPDNEGNDKEAYTYSGTLKACSEVKITQAASDDEWETCAISEIGEF